MSDDAAAFRRIPLEIFNEGRLELIDELVAEDFVEHAAPPPFPQTREASRQYVQAVRSAFADFRYEVPQQRYLRASGTMTGDFLEMSATGKSATWEEIHIGRYADGKLAEHWAAVDQLGMLQQLGFVPTQPAS